MNESPKDRRAKFRVIEGGKQAGEQAGGTLTERALAFADRLAATAVEETAAIHFPNIQDNVQSLLAINDEHSLGQMLLDSATAPNRGDEHYTEPSLRRALALAYIAIRNRSEK